MGMAASQARYLALVARKSNCEYEGQQINQARTALSNQSANLFNQMLGLQVPIPPSTQDFTKTQYSYTDGYNSSTISDWHQLGTNDPDYNYVVTHYYYTDRYTGSQKLLNDPQVQFSADPATLPDMQQARKDVEDCKKTLEYYELKYQEAELALTTATVNLSKAQEEAATLSNYGTTSSITTAVAPDADANYTVGTTKYVPYSSLSTKPDEMIAALVDNGAYVSEEAVQSDFYFSEDGTSFVLKSELEALSTASSSNPKNLTIYTNSKVQSNSEDLSDAKTAVTTAQSKLTTAQSNLTTAQTAYDTAVEAYNSLTHPEYLGNSELTPLATLTEDQEAEIRQVVNDMLESGVTADIINYYDPATGQYNGGIYSFKLNGVTYYTTYTDLANSYNSGTGANNIDGQAKLAYYNASYVSTKIEETEKALIETDGDGRFASIRFENDSIKYNLKMETVTDDAAYEDAMNQYYYENAKYDKMVQDINAKTSIIQQQDQQLELRLKQLDTEQNALATEIDAVSKVVKDNVEKSFKTFGG